MKIILLIFAILTFTFLTFLLFFYENNDPKILSFFDEWDEVAKVMSQKIETGDIDGAKSVFDAHKGSLKAGWDSIPKTRSGRNTKIYMSAAVKKRRDESSSKNFDGLTKSTASFASKFGSDKSKTEKLQNLLKEHRDLFR